LIDVIMPDCKIRVGTGIVWPGHAAGNHSWAVGPDITIKEVVVMKKLLPTLIAASGMLCASGQAAEPQAQFVNDQGMLVIPHLNLGNEIYYVQLDRTDPNGYVFSLNGGSVVKVTPAEGDDWASADEVLGEWKMEDFAGLTITFGADGSYELDHPAEDDCTAGIESGTYGYSEDTGVLYVRVLTDGNGECGLSHPDGPVRASRDGADLLLTIYDYTESPDPQVVRLSPL
jgi:hypothetical protein